MRIYLMRKDVLCVVCCAVKTKCVEMVVRTDYCAERFDVERSVAEGIMLKGASWDDYLRYFCANRAEVASFCGETLGGRLVLGNILCGEILVGVNMSEINASCLSGVRWALPLCHGPLKHAPDLKQVWFSIGSVYDFAEIAVFYLYFHFNILFRNVI